MIILLVILTTLGVFTQNIPVAHASPDVLYFHETSSSICSGTNRWQMDKTDNTGDTTDNSVDTSIGSNGVDYWIGGNTNPYTWIFNSTLSEAYTLTGNVTYTWWDNTNLNPSTTVTITFYIYDVSSGCTFTQITGTPDSFSYTLNKNTTSHSLTGSTSFNYTFAVGNTIAIRATVRVDSRAPLTYTFWYDSETYYTNVNMPGTIVPENLLYFIPIIPFLPKIIEVLNKRKKRKLKTVNK